jgi:hypothetical protein
MADDPIRWALRELLRTAPKAVGCDDFHHGPLHRHMTDQDCPLVKRYFAALAAAEKALEPN